MTTQDEYEKVLERLCYVNMAIMPLQKINYESQDCETLQAMDLLISAREKYIKQHEKMIEGWFDEEEEE